MPESTAQSGVRKSERSAVRRLIGRIMEIADRVAARKWLVIAAFGIVPIIVNPIFSLFMGIPHPQGTDEFGYLLMADTFAHGRIANPPHPLWEHFQTFAEIHHPTRTAISPPLQGIFLCIGQTLFHLPIAGVWLSIGLMCASLAWMLYGWLRPTWALVGALLAFINLGCYTYWSHAYWGGAPSTIGGCLVFGALPRLFTHIRTRYAVMLGVGCLILANSRPFEGFIACLPVAIAIGWLLVKAPQKQRNFIRIVVPLITIFTIMACGILASNKITTGKALLFPHILITKEISSVPMLLWQKPGPEPSFTNQIFKEVEISFAQAHYLTKRSSLKGFLSGATFNLVSFVNFYLNPAIVIILLLALLRFIKKRDAVFALGTVCLVAGLDALGLSWLNQPNYIAPVSCLIFFLVASGFRYVSVLRIKRLRFGRIAMILLLIISLGFSGFNLVVNRMRPAFRPFAKEQSYSRGAERDRILSDLTARGGRHCVVVRYGKNHAFFEEWVYNGADIDGSLVVFARELDTERNRNLVRYFADRQFWILDVYDDNRPPKLLPYPAGR